MTKHRPMFDADYSAIEARITCWVAGEETALAEYRAQDAAKTKEEKERLDRYRLMACDIYGIPIEEVTKFPQRFIGKSAILGCGFGCAAPKFRTMCKTMGGYDLPVGLEFTVVDKFRSKHQRIKAAWYEVDGAAKNAIIRKGAMFEAAKCKFICKDVGYIPFLLIRLPSGRKLAYPRPRVQPSKKFPPPATEIVYFGQLGQTRNWGDVGTYGGKILENCLSGKTLVCSKERGWVRLDSVKQFDLIFDGVEFVTHGGLANRGRQTTINLHGLGATPDHLFLAGEKWVSAELACTLPIQKLSSVNEDCILSASRSTLEPVGKYLRESVCASTGEGQRQENNVGVPVRLRQANDQSWCGPSQRKNRWLWNGLSRHQSGNARVEANSRHERAPGVCGSSEHVGALSESKSPSLEELWWEGDFHLPEVARLFREFLGGYGANVSSGVGHRQERQQRELFKGKLPLDNAESELPKQTKLAKAGRCAGKLLRLSKGERDQTKHLSLPGKSGIDVATNFRNPGEHGEHVFDLVNCGPRKRFAVKTPNGEILIAHNCVQGIAADIMAIGAHNAEQNGFPIITLIHDQALGDFNGKEASEFVRHLTNLPAWADGLPIEAEGGLVDFYKKD